ncbi:hypothetical protein SEA_KABOCHA_119 [Gordonia phage Kabocha]|uniref:Uncharacterized protein n=1 Tax=Gordonia phage Chidiebere TaxID=2656530 RepID=A0A649VLE2_9CAUD|nr:hypothetical protein PQD14_gp118 [Gordonia phage Chidiebere]QGJ93004.1 hypothetical protein PBI_CHIDIEBERE_118 [Gordonia phage Chidiebere]WAA19905.1 hypothetical protein SEA_KABOCHA_119 [Gordonia phage Kabocha]WAA20094.1 hypothetical protein SEA_HANEM_117 [Gordonia phage Hanem]WNM67137.1 hypothetical protein SEA_SCHOMBER_116 [Gordonia Phage Schomber]
MALKFPEEVPYDLNNSQHAVMEWIEIPDPLDEDHRYRVNATFFLSNYNCVFGAGCQGIKPQVDGHRTDAGCCEQGVGFMDDEDYRNVKRNVAQLTRADMPADKLKYAREKGWTVKKPGSDEPYKTRKLDGACIFANPTPVNEGDPPAGCAFHVMAARKGISFLDTKPETCWKVPLLLEPGHASTTDKEVTVVTAQGRGEWRGMFPDDYTDLEQVTDTRYLGWWCTDTPDAYNGGTPAYVYFEEELRRLMSDEAYELLAKMLTEYGPRRTQMPGERVNDGQPTIGTVEQLVASLRAKAEQKG